jgi:predicted dehydrogenase
MLADPDLEAVIVATSDAFHVAAAKAALAAGKHVLCEKPLGVSVEEVEDLRRAVVASGRVLQVGHMKRFDAGLRSAKDFVVGEMGEMLALKAWYCDSTHRYAMTDAVQPAIARSASAKRPAEDPKADLKRYFMLAHGSHLVDLARYFAGPIVEVDARLREAFGAYCWFVDVAFASGAIGHLDLTIPVRADWREGVEIYGRNGSVSGKIYNPWYYKSSDVEIFHEATATTTRVLGADGHFYRRQLEGFAATVLEGAPMLGADVEDGVASVRAMAAIARSAASRKPVRLADVDGRV